MVYFAHAEGKEKKKNEYSQECPYKNVLSIKKTWRDEDMNNEVYSLDWREGSMKKAIRIFVFLPDQRSKGHSYEKCL